MYIDNRKIKILKLSKRDKNRNANLFLRVTQESCIMQQALYRKRKKKKNKKTGCRCYYLLVIELMQIIFSYGISKKIE